VFGLLRAACESAPSNSTRREGVDPPCGRSVRDPLEPKEIDEKLAIELRHLAENAVLKGKLQGEEKCEDCRYYFENTAETSYCWHPKLRILVGADWSCQWWEAIPDE
jgi:hypothetical protein